MRFPEQATTTAAPPPIPVRDAVQGEEQVQRLDEQDLEEPVPLEEGAAPAPERHGAREGELQDDEEHPLRADRERVQEHERGHEEHEQHGQVTGRDAARGSARPG